MFNNLKKVHIDNAMWQIKSDCIARAKEIYGEVIPQDVLERLVFEFACIAKTDDAASKFLIAQELAKKSVQLGYRVGSRGSLQASLVAYLMGITEIDPLSDRWGRLAPETYYGLGGQAKDLDIYLNFAPEVRPEIFNHLEEMFPDGTILRGGTTKEDETGESKRVGCHPGATYIVPQGIDPEEVTPIESITDDDGRTFLVTVYDYHYVDDFFTRIDILEYADLGRLRLFEENTGCPIDDIPEDDAKTMELFRNGDTEDIPIFSDEASREALKRIQPETLADLVDVNGLVHMVGPMGKIISECNAETKLYETICCRDDILYTLMDKGVDRAAAGEIMHRVSRGKGLTDEMELLMRAVGISDEYIDICNSATYLFPRAHAAAYTQIAWRLAYYKARR